MKPIWILLVFILIQGVSVSGQRTRDTPQINRNDGSTQATQPDSLQSEKASNLPDTTIYSIVKIKDLTREISYADTTLDNFHTYHSLYQQDLFDADLGNFGSASKALFYRPLIRRGIHFGYDQYESYRRTNQDMYFFNLNRPFTSFYYSPQSGDNFIVKAIFSRSFANNINFTLDYQRVSQKGIYQHQATKSTNMNFGFWKKGGRHEVLLTGTINAINEENNGGITSDTLFNLPLYNFRTRIPVNLENANTRHAMSQANLTNYFHLANGVERNTDLIFKHSFTFERGSYKFYDEDSSMDSIYYLTFYIDPSKLRSYTQYTNYQNEAGVKLNLKIGQLFVGINHTYSSILQGSNASGQHNTYLIYDGETKNTGAFNLSYEGHLGLFGNIGEYLLRASTELDLRNLGKIKFQIESGIEQVGLVYQNFYLNEQSLWSTSFIKPKTNVLSAELQLKSIKLKLQGNIINLTDPTYFNETRYPVQWQGNVTISQLLLNHKLGLGPIHLEQSLGLQNISDNIFQLPTWLSKHNLYIEAQLFKKMKSRLGAEIRMNQSYKASGYFPVTGQFHLRSDGEVVGLKLIDAYASFKIDQLRVFLKMENINHLVRKDISYNFRDYPLFDSNFRIGLSWLLKD